MVAAWDVAGRGVAQNRLPYLARLAALLAEKPRQAETPEFELLLTHRRHDGPHEIAMPDALVSLEGCSEPRIEL